MEELLEIKYINSKGIESIYNPITTYSLSKEDYELASIELVKKELPLEYKKYKDDKDLLLFMGWHIVLTMRDEALLQMLPQEIYSKAGTYPHWIAAAIDKNVFHKDILLSDLDDIFEYENLSDKEKLEAIKYYIKRESLVKNHG